MLNCGEYLWGEEYPGGRARYADGWPRGRDFVDWLDKWCLELKGMVEDIIGGGFVFLECMRELQTVGD